MTLSHSSRSTFLFSSFALGALLAVACSSSTASTPTGTSGGTSGTATSGGTPATAADCSSRCEAKFVKCGDTTGGKSNCMSQVCSASPTADQLTCLENKTCDEIAGAMSFTALCPGSASTSGGTSGGTSGSTTTTGVTCGSATCSASQYCALTYDSTAAQWNDGTCRAVPAACTSSSASELCTCMSKNSDCPTSGLVNTKCNQDNGNLKFGCTN
jgi:hypothetical protein